jgi:predicted CXXCH cytochrome family protein
MAPAPSPPRAGRLRPLVLLAACALLVAAAAAWFAWRRAPDPALPAASDLPPDPRLTYDGPFRNVHPSVGYVGDAKCAECHLDFTLVYDTHPMGRSMAPIRALAADQPYDRAHNMPFDVRGVRLSIERRGGRVWHNHARLDEGRPVWEASQEVHHVVGSGTHGYSYLGERDGYVFQTPISWFTQKGGWDLSPGFQGASWPGRPVVTECLYCHANRLKPMAGYRDRFEAGVFDGLAIGCERCHGPGQKHAERHERGEPRDGDFDATIVNPSRLPWQLRENVCEQCHLGGEAREPRRGREWGDYRPGAALEDFVAVFVKDPSLPGSHRAVGQVEQMRRSKCFEKTDGRRKLGCVSCHDPHQRPERGEMVRHYQKRCLACHKERGCSEPVARRRQKQPDDSCVACHMPPAATADIAHTALTDHRIVRFAKAAEAPPDPVSALRVVPFQRDRIDPDDHERWRDLGVALVRLATRPQVPPRARLQVVGEAARLLDQALRRAPTDPAGWRALGRARMTEERFDAAYYALRRAVELEPLDYALLEDLARVEVHRDQIAEGRDHLRQAVRINPYVATARRTLALILVREADWAGAAEHARAWAQLEPDSAEARHALVRCLLEQGRRDDARREFEQLRKLKPTNLAELEAWYERRSR